MPKNVFTVIDKSSLYSIILTCMYKTYNILLLTGFGTRESNSGKELES